MEKLQWLTLNYTLPREPSRVRVSIWRKLKKAGAVVLGQSVWIMPFHAESQAAFREIAAEILQSGGEAYVMQGVFLDEAESGQVLNLFNRARDEEYEELLEKCRDLLKELEKETGRENFTFAELEENEDEMEKLTAWQQRIAGRDFYCASLRASAQTALDTCRERLEQFSAQVYLRSGSQLP